jgi:hypothetical protein
MFAGNAPEGKKLVRLKVDMKGQIIINSKGVHVVGSFNNFNYTSSYMYNFFSRVYEYQAYADSGASVNYLYVNGNSESGVEVLPATCNVNGKRQVVLNTDIVLDSTCFSNCDFCAMTGINKLENVNNFTIFPNPALEEITIRGLNETAIFTITIFDTQGCLVLDRNIACNQSISLIGLPIVKGIYVVKIQSGNQVSTKKLMLY